MLDGGGEWGGGFCVEWDVEVDSCGFWWVCCVLCGVVFEGVFDVFVLGNGACRVLEHDLVEVGGFIEFGDEVDVFWVC